MKPELWDRWRFIYLSDLIDNFDELKEEIKYHYLNAELFSINPTWPESLEEAKKQNINCIPRTDVLTAKIGKTEKEFVFVYTQPFEEFQRFLKEVLNATR